MCAFISIALGVAILLTLIRLCDFSSLFVDELGFTAPKHISCYMEQNNTCHTVSGQAFLGQFIRI